MKLFRLQGALARRLSLAAVAVGSLFLAVPTGFAATPNTPYSVFAVDSPISQPFARFPERLADARDLTGDRVRDIFASSYKIDRAGMVDAGAVFLFSGANRSLVYEISPPEPQANAQFGFYISVPGDVDRDGKDDLVVGAAFQDVYTGTGTACGAAEPNGCNENQGKAYVFSGRSGQLLYAIDNPRPQSDEGVFGSFGSRIGAAGEVTGDGTPDILVGSPANDVPAGCGNLSPIPAGCRKNEGEAFIFNGATGALVRTLNVPAADRQDPSCTTTSSTARCGNFGGTVQSPGDVDRDGVADQLVAAYALRPTPDRFGRMYLFSGADGSVLARFDAPEPDPSQFFGLQDVAPLTPGDVNKDGVPDIYGDAFGQDGPAGQSQGKAWVFDGKASVAAGRGVLLYEVRDPTPRAGESFGFSASKTFYNNDMTPDLYVGGLSGSNTETYVIDGKNGKLLKTLGLPASEIQPDVPGNDGNGLGWSSRAPGDLNGDGEPDYVAAAPFTDVGGNQDQGRLYFFLSGRR